MQMLTEITLRSDKCFQWLSYSTNEHTFRGHLANRGLSLILPLALLVDPLMGEKLKT